MGFMKQFGRLVRPHTSLQKILTIIIFVWGFHVTLIKPNRFSFSQENFIDNLETPIQQQQQQHRHISSINQSIDLTAAIEAQKVRQKVLRHFCKTSNVVVKNEVSTEYNNHQITLISDPENRLGYCHVPKVASSAW